MKKNLFFAVFPSLLFCTYPLFSSELKLEDIQAEIEKHIEQTQGRTKKIKEIESNSPVTAPSNDFFKENNLYIDYFQSK